MTIISCKRLRGGGGTSETVEGDGPVKNVYRIPYLLKTTTTADDFQTIAVWFNANVYAAGLAYAQGNGFDLTSFAHRLSGDRREDMPTWWELELEFQPRTNDSKDEKDDGSKTDDPLEARDTVEVEDVIESAPVERATYRSGWKPDSAADTFLAPGDKHNVCNSALDRITDPAPEKEVHRKQIRIVVRMDEYPDDLVDQYENRVNSVEHQLYKPKYGIQLTFKPYTLRVVSIKSSGVAWENRIRYWPVEFLLDWYHELDADGNPIRTWRRKELDRGRHRAAAPGEPDGRGSTLTSEDLPQGVAQLHVQEDSDGNVLDEPVLLDGGGQPLTFGADPVFIEWSDYEEAELYGLFGVLNDDDEIES